MKRVLILTNSQGSEIGLSANDHSYPFIFRNRFRNMFNINFVTASGSMIDFACINRGIIDFYNPDFILFNFGVVECTPRILSRVEKKLFEIVPFGHYLTNYLHKKRSFVVKSRSFLGINSLEMKIINYKKHTKFLSNYLRKKNCKPFFLKMNPISIQQERCYLPFFNKYSEEFNKASTCLGLVDLLAGFEGNPYQFNSVHFTKHAHEHIAQEFLKLLLRQ